MTESAAKKETKAAAKAEAGKSHAPPKTAAARGRVYDSILDTVGGTPLVRLPKLTQKYKLQAEILAKLEYFNPTGSVKDRAALALIEDAEREGKIRPGKSILVEPTAGNAGISLAWAAGIKGYRLLLVMPESTPLERQRLLRFLGAELILIAPEKGMKGATEIAKNYLKESKDYYLLKQFENPASVAMHAETTAEEIWKDAGGKVDVFVAGVGTGATITGVAQTLRQKNPDVRIFAVEPAESAVLSGEKPGAHKIQGIGSGSEPPILNLKLIDSVMKVTSEQALKAARELARVEGIPGGISSGANIAAALEIAKMPDMKGKVIVTLIPSFAERYITSALFQGMNKGDW